MSDNYVDRVLELVRQANLQADVMFIDNEETPVVFETNRLKSILSRQTRGASIRIVKDGRIGFASTNRLDDPSALVTMALETVQFGATAAFSFPGAADVAAAAIFDSGVADAPVGDLVQLGQRLIDRVLEGNDDILCEARISKSVMTVRIANTAGGDFSYRKSAFSHSVEGTRIRGTDMLFVGDGEVSCRAPENPLHIAEKTRQQLEWCKENVDAPSGQVPILFTSDGVAGVLAGPLSVALNGKTVLQQASPLTGRLGETVFDERVSIWDDGTLDYRPGSEPVDDEGVPVRRRALIEGGKVASFFYDLQTAGLAGTASTGNAGRGLDSLPVPSLHNVVMAGGDRTFDQLLADLGDGIVVEQVIGAEQGNVLGGDFGGNVILGYRVKNGKILGRVKDTMISGNVYEALKQIGAIGSERSWVHGAMYLPAILIEHVGVSTGWKAGMEGMPNMGGYIDWLSRWRKLVIERAEQGDRWRGAGQDSDYWSRSAQRFANLTRGLPEDDPFLSALKDTVTPEDTVLDVGAGAGRFATAIAPYVKRVIALDPSPGMLDQLRGIISERNLSNIEPFQGSWPESAELLEPVDVVFSAHAFYWSEEIAPFLRSIDRLAKRTALMTARAQQADGYLRELFPIVHGEPRNPEPVFLDLYGALCETGIWPDTRMVRGFQRSYASFDELVENAAGLLFVEPSALKTDSIERHLRDVVTEREGRVWIEGAQSLAGIAIWNH